MSPMPSSVKGLGQARSPSLDMAPGTRCCSGAVLRRRLPILAWLPDYSLQWLRLDFIAGLSVGLTVIPQALAYAEVAGLPPQVKWLTPVLAVLSPQPDPSLFLSVCPQDETPAMKSNTSIYVSDPDSPLVSNLLTCDLFSVPSWS